MAFKDARKHGTLCVVTVARRERVSPNVIRVTVTGEELDRLADHGYDHWFRLFVPSESGTTDWNLPAQLGLAGYLKYLRMPSETRPVLRNYTVRDFRKAERELDIDFVVHGDGGPASRWAQRAQPGETLAILDQGCGWEEPPGTDFRLLAGDETAMPAILGILSDLPSDAAGLAIIEVPEAADRQTVEAPEGMEVRWLDRSACAEPHGKPGRLALAELRATPIADPQRTAAYVCGEQELAAEGRRHLVAAGVPKPRIAFVGYWRAGKAAY